MLQLMPNESTKEYGTPNGLNLNSGCGIYLQSVLMHALGELYAKKLHEQKMNPYSQFVNNNIWHISTLTDEADKRISVAIDDIIEAGGFELKQLGMRVQVSGVEVQEVKPEELAKVFYSGIHPNLGAPGSPDGESSATIQQANSEIIERNSLSLQFLTPTSFKSGKYYVNMPTPRLVLQNLMMKYSSVFEQSEEIGEQILEEIERNCNIVQYNLRSYYYNLGGKEQQKIPGFLGTIKLGVRGSESLKNYVAMLLKFAEFSGVGIKTGMGMGGVKVI